ncbi:UPF0061-domain-containing protein [Panus rudis PR-1116 ss-1]|nr:UPF0061-domain-containing protein [Panus rudis PR-1116 ss-1]
MTLVSARILAGSFRKMPTTTRVPIASLPLPPSSHILPQNLTPDPHTPSPSAFRKVQREKPSIQRRARILAPPAHFSYVTPCPIAFPYKVEPEEGEEVTDTGDLVEKWLSKREALHDKPTATSNAKTPLKKYYPTPGKRDQRLELIGLSEAGLKDCLPHLNVGDAFETLGSPTLSKALEDIEDLPAAPVEDVEARQELIDVLSGHATLMAVDEGSETSWAPWSLRYSGHQFGTFAGQLGDGRAISILATPHPEDPDTITELQLKGSGRTPFSRSADGLAVVRSSIREFLGAEAMNALGIPTTRSLSLISLPETPVQRERTESACVLCRLAPSFIRVGNFEALNPPANMFFFGGGQQDGDWEAMRILGEWTSKRALKITRDGEDEPWAKNLVMEAARRNAVMVAGWQAYGFMHGVINTDNVSILGLTIDYGPYAFMDVFDTYHICNHTDDSGRYSYQAQPSMIIYALRSLVNVLAPVIGAEAELGKAVPPGWAEGVSKEQIDEWRNKGLELAKEEMEILAQETCGQEYGRLMHKRLALRRLDKDDEGKLSRPLLRLMEDHKLDFHSTFRRLAYFSPSIMADEASLNNAIDTLLALTPDPDRVDRERAVGDYKDWLKRYADRIESERDEWVKDIDGKEGLSEEDVRKRVDEERKKASRAANPRFVLRQWVLEEVIAAVEKDADSGKRILRKVLQMVTNPFNAWGAEDDPADSDSLDAEIKEERRYCGLGERRYLGFQCSCSS